MFVSIHSFGNFSDKPLKILNELGYQVILNNLGRKLNYDETIELAKDCVTGSGIKRRVLTRNQRVIFLTLVKNQSP